MERSSPNNRLNSVDLPTFGRPMMATRGMDTSPSAGVGRSSPALSVAGSENSATTASSRSPVPRPCSALTGYGSPRPSDTNSHAAASRLASSTLFTTRCTGGPARRITLAAARSSSVTPVVTSTIISTTSASARARSACSLTLASSVSPAASHPPVSTTSKGTPAHSAVSTLRSRVTPGSSSTTAARAPTMRLTSEDFPTLGRPATTTRGSVMPRTPARTSGRRGRRGGTGRRTARFRPAAAGRPTSARPENGPR